MDVAYLSAFLDAWCDSGDPPRLSKSWRRSIEKWRELGLPLDDLLRLVAQVLGDDAISHDYRWTYLCGACWRALEDAGRWHKLTPGQVLNALRRGPLRRKDLAAHVGRRDDDGDFARMLRCLLDEGRIRKVGHGVYDRA